MTFFRLAIWAISACVIGASHAAAGERWSLVEAALSDVRDISHEPGAPAICLDEQCVARIDGSWRMTFTINRTLAGPKLAGVASWDQASSQPILGRRYLLVVADDAGKRRTEWIGSRQSGLCIEPDDITRMGLGAIARRFPCR